jgi:geranylgeranyl diphosphate synthase type II
VSDAIAGPGPDRIDENRMNLADRAKGLIEARLKHHVETWPGTSGRLSAAAGQALLAPSKRVRPVLLCLFAAAGERIPDAAIDAGCAVEMVHTASLILDDLPCMDNAATRRSRASTHVAFGQATAILAAVALLTRAFELLGNLPEVSPEGRVKLCEVLSGAVGLGGLSAGQDIDVNDRWAFQTTDQIEQLNWLKTGILFSAAAEMGALIRRTEGARLAEVRRFARHLGQAFQTADDLLDRMAHARETGKDVGKDRGFATIVSLLGETRAQAECAEHILHAQAALEGSGIAPRPVISYVTNLLASRAVVTP